MLHSNRTDDLPEPKNMGNDHSQSPFYQEIPSPASEAMPDSAQNIHSKPLLAHENVSSGKTSYLWLSAGQC